MFTPSATPPARHTDVPIYWFAKLERAVQLGDFQAAAEAQRNLERLGVVVRYGPPPVLHRGALRVF